MSQDQIQASLAELATLTVEAEKATAKATQLKKEIVYAQNRAQKAVEAATVLQGKLAAAQAELTKKIQTAVIPAKKTS